MKKVYIGFALFAALFGTFTCSDGGGRKAFNREKDLISLHYDHAPDKDDGHSAAADRTILQSMFGKEWIKKHAVAVSGAYGKNADQFNPRSAAVMDAAWKDCGGWFDAHTNRGSAVSRLADRWIEVLKAGGDVWVKEGGQSDLTAEALRRIKSQVPYIETEKRIHVVQHSAWNEAHTTQTALAYAKKHARYIKIRDANAYLNRKKGNEAFVRAAGAHPVFGNVWSVAFAYYSPAERLDFSDTGELMFILELGEMGIDDFRKKMLLPEP